MAILQANGQEAPMAKCIAWSGGVGPAPICGKPLPLGQLFCPTDWALISHGVRQAIIGEIKRLRNIRAKQPSQELQQLLQVAVKQNLDARCAADPEFAKRVVDFAEQAKAAQKAAAAGIEVPNGERYGIQKSPQPPTSGPDGNFLARKLS